MERTLTHAQSGSGWTFEPWFTIPLAIAVAIYAVGMIRIWQRAGIGRGIDAPRAASFFGAVLTLIIAITSPLDAWSEELAWAHMIQHLLLIFVAAPLLVRSNFPLALLWAIPRGKAQSLGQGINRTQTPRLWRALTSPVAAWVLFAMVFWVWHASALYEAALEHEGVHILEHVLFLVTSMLFWWVLLQPTEQKHRHYGMLVLYLFTTMLQSGILGALMTFAPAPWYPYYAETTAHWGLTPLQDQQLAGLIMWIIGGAILTLLAIGYFAAWLRALEDRSARLQHRKGTQELSQ